MFEVRNKTDGQRDIIVERLRVKVNDKIKTFGYMSVNEAQWFYDLVDEAIKESFLDRAIKAIEEKIFRYPNCPESRTRNDVMHEVTEALKQLVCNEK